MQRKDSVEVPPCPEELIERLEATPAPGERDNEALIQSARWAVEDRRDRLTTLGARFAALSKL